MKMVVFQMDGNTKISPEFKLRSKFKTLYSISKPSQVHKNYAYIYCSRHTCYLIATHRTVKSVITGWTQKYIPKKENHKLGIYVHVFILCMCSWVKFRYQMRPQISHLVKAYYSCLLLLNDDVIKWKHFPRYWSLVNSSTKASDAELWCCLWSAPE